jgi:peptidoglycan biosynthesis protein MviN/MurJ (putative lipid II flippase)
MVAIQSLGLPFMALSVVFTAAHHSRHRYVAAEARALVPNLVFLGALLAFLPRSSVEVAAWLMVGRQVLTCLALAPVDLLRTPTPRNGGRVAEVVRRSMPLIAGALVYKSGPFVDRYISSFAPAGSLTLLGLAQQGYAALLHLFDKSGASIFTGQMSELCSTGRTPEALALYRRAAKGIIPIATAVAAAAIAAVWCLGELAAAHCWVPASSARGLALLVAVLGGTLPGGAWGQVAAGGLYAAGRTGVVAAYATLGFLTSVAIKVLSFYMLGLHGLAVGVVAYQFINAATLHAVLIRDLRRSGG